MGRSLRSAGAAWVIASLCGCTSPEPVTPPPDSPELDPEPLKKPSPPEPEPEPVVVTEPVDIEPARQAHAAVRAHFFDDGLPEHELVHFTPIEDPSGRALTSFHQALRDLAAGKDPDGKVRVAVYGSSSVAADRYTAYLRGYLQHRFGDGGIGFVAAVPLWRWHRHDAVLLEASSRWTIEHAQREKGRLDGLYGLLGASASADHKRAFTAMLPKRRSLHDAAATDRLELWFLRHPEGGRFDLRRGRTELGTVQTRSEQIEPGYHPVPVDGGALPLKLAVRGDGEVRLFGAVLENDEPGVVVDELGIGGTRAANHLDWNEAIWSEHIGRRSPALYMLAYGANEAVDEDEPIEVYQDNLDKVLSRFKATLPEASCVLIGPQDFPMQDEAGQWVTRPRMNPIVQAQKVAAARHECGFFDSRAMMGGMGTMPSWVAADPPLAKDDHLHLTPLGYTYLGSTLTDAIMAGYDLQK